MPESDRVFTDAMSGRYEKLLGPALFAPFAEHVCDVVLTHRPSDVLETAAGALRVCRPERDPVGSRGSGL